MSGEKLETPTGKQWAIGLGAMALLCVIALIVAVSFGMQRSGDRDAAATADENTELRAPTPTAAPQQVSITAPTSAPPSSGCAAHGNLPDPACTPGAVIGGVTVAQICVPGYSKGVRNVPQAEKDAVYRAYGIQSHAPGQYEVDHLISLELGGSNDQANLWPEAADPRPGFHEKDRVENEAHAAVCMGTLSLADAQHAIATDWISLMHRLEGR